MCFLRFVAPMWLMGLRLVGGCMVHFDVFLCTFLHVLGRGDGDAEGDAGSSTRCARSE